MARTIPIIGEPPPPIADRPICTGCNRHLRPYFDLLYGHPPGTGGIGTLLVGGWPTGKRWSGQYHGRGYSGHTLPRFHSAGCAVNYALAAAAWFDEQGKTFRPRGKTTT